MKYTTKFTTFLTILLFSSALYAEPFSTFKASEHYQADGRWFQNGKNFIFRVNEGNANEENIRFEKNPHQLLDKVKYRLCFKIKDNCQLNCEAESIKEIKTIPPWVDIEALAATPDGSYPSSSLKDCRGDSL